MLTEVSESFCELNFISWVIKFNSQKLSLTSVSIFLSTSQWWRLRKLCKTVMTWPSLSSPPRPVCLHLFLMMLSHIGGSLHLPASPLGFRFRALIYGLFHSSFKSSRLCGLKEVWKRPYKYIRALTASLNRMEGGAVYHQYGTTSSRRKWKHMLRGEGGASSLSCTMSPTISPGRRN